MFIITVAKKLGPQLLWKYPLHAGNHDFQNQLSFLMISNEKGLLFRDVFSSVPS